MYVSVISAINCRIAEYAFLPIFTELCNDKKIFLRFLQKLQVLFHRLRSHIPGIHHYNFTIYALNVEKLDIKKDTAPKEVESLVISHSIAKSTLCGLFERK